MPRPPVSGCEKSRGQIESLLGHQTRRKRLLSPPTYMETCLQHLVFTLLCHKVPENSLKAGECFLLTIKFGEELNWICFDCFSYFISMAFSISDPEADTIKFGEAIVFVSAIFAYLCQVLVSCRSNILLSQIGGSHPVPSLSILSTARYKFSVANALKF